MAKYLLYIVLLLPLLARAQNALDFRQVYANPFLFNPAYAGYSGFTEIGVAYRQQWVDFEDSPRSSGFTLSTPITQRAAIGFTLFTQNSVSMTTSVFQTAVAYAVPFNKHSSLRFALSGGAGIDRLDLEGRDYSNDPLILQAAQNRFYGEASFGMLYTAGAFRLGFTLPTLINHQEIGGRPVEIHPLSHLLNQLYTVRYKVNLKNERFALEPYALYRLNRDLQNYWEAAAILHIDEALMVGFSWNQYYGAGFYFGFAFRQRYRVHYGWELPNYNSVGSHSHELHLIAQLEKKPGHENVLLSGAPKTEPVKSATVWPPVKPVPKSLPFPPEFDGVFGTFSDFPAALTYMADLWKQGIKNVGMDFHPDQNKYLIYAHQVK
jgi:type IX secretion system PorP/SprF family membrane protein